MLVLIVIINEEILFNFDLREEKLNLEVLY